MRLILFTVTFSQAQIVQTLQIEFTKTTIKTDAEECVSGRIFFQQPDRMCLIINDPVNQWIFAGVDSMVLYYPDDSLAFRFKTSYPVTFPFFQAFLGVVQEDYGLSSIGYTLTDHHMNDTVLTTVWSPPDDAPDEVGMFVLTYAQEKLTDAEYMTRDKQTLSQTWYRNHTQYGAYYFPMEIEKIQCTENDTIFETIVYTDPQFNRTLPDTLMNFCIPEYVSIENITW